MSHQGKGKIEQAFKLAGTQHRYQHIVILLISLLWIQINYVMLGPTLIYMDPIFTCDGYGQVRVQQHQACSIIEKCRLIDDFSLTARLSLYCQKEWARDSIQSIFAIGSFIGLITLNIISDTKGRRVSIIISLLITNIGVIFSLLGGLLSSIPLIIIAQFLNGFGSFALCALSYTVLSDCCSNQLRSKGVIIINSAWGISTATLGVYFIYQVNWLYYLLYILLIPLIGISIATIFFIQQSPYLLMSQHKKAEALQCLTKIAKINGRQFNLPQIEKIIQQQEDKNEQNKASLKNVFKVIRLWDNLKAIILLTLIRGTGGLNFYSISYAFDYEGYGFGLNSIIAGCMEMTSFIYLSLFITKLKRRQGIALFFGLTEILGLFFLLSVIKSSSLTQTLMLAISRIFSTIAYNLVACMQVESFSIQIQSTAVGIIQAFNLFGCFSAPLLVDLADKIGIDPIAFVSMFIIFAIWPTIFLKQTLVKKEEQVQKPLLSDTTTSIQCIPQYIQQTFKQSILSSDEKQDHN